MDTQININTRDGIELEAQVTRHGHRDVVLFLHGYSCFMRSTNAINQLMETFGSQHGDADVVHLRMRGFGQQAYRGSLNHELWVADVVDTLKQLGYKRAVLVACGVESQVAINFALQQPERCKSLVLMDALFPEGLPNELFVAHRLRLGVWVAAKFVQILNVLGVRRPPFVNQLLGRFSWPLSVFLQAWYEFGRPMAAMDEIDVPVLALFSRQIESRLLLIARYRMASLERVEFQCIEEGALRDQPSSAGLIERWVTQRI